jgi:hypothetical protein
MSGSSHENLSPSGHQLEFKKKKKKLSVMSEKSENADEDQNEAARQHRRFNSSDDHGSEPNPHFVVTPATMPVDPLKGLTPSQLALLNNPLYQHIRRSVIHDITASLQESPRYHSPSALSNTSLVSSIAFRPVPSEISAHWLPTLDSYSEAYLANPHFYNPGKARRSGPSSHFHPSPTPSQQRLNLVSPEQSVRRLRAMDRSTREGDLSATTEAITSGGPPHQGHTVTQMETAKPIKELSGSSDISDISDVRKISERPYIPELKWEDRKKWPSFIKTWPFFLWTTIQDSFSTNPYKLHPFVYIAMGTCLLWCILAKCALIIIGMFAMMSEPWNDNAYKEAMRLTDSTVGILPYVVQLVLFLFPPLLASQS